MRTCTTVHNYLIYWPNQQHYWKHLYVWPLICNSTSHLINESYVMDAKSKWLFKCSEVKGCINWTSMYLKTYWTNTRTHLLSSSTHVRWKIMNKIYFSHHTFLWLNQRARTESGRAVGISMLHPFEVLFESSNNFWNTLPLHLSVRIWEQFSESYNLYNCSNTPLFQNGFQKWLHREMPGGKLCVCKTMM